MTTSRLSHGFASLSDLDGLRTLLDASVSGLQERFLDPRRNPAKVRAMYAHPMYARGGIARLILSLCVSAARGEWFSQFELMATKSGELLYMACGYLPIEHIQDDRGAAPVPLVRMQKRLA
jgi:GNAT superfamily N-acetyltransferase